MQEGQKQKIPYNPSEIKRFEISQDGFSKERVRVLSSIFKEVKQLLPELPIAFTLGGSLAKGKILTSDTARHSDIDLYVFLRFSTCSRNLFKTD